MFSPGQTRVPRRFLGRIWVEDQDYNVVRFNGTYSPHPRTSYYLHFDSWRLNIRPGTWLPAYVYSEESDLKSRPRQEFAFPGSDPSLGIRLESPDQEFRVYPDSGGLSAGRSAVKDQSDAGADASSRGGRAHVGAPG